MSSDLLLHQYVTFVCLLLVHFVDFVPLCLVETLQSDTQDRQQLNIEQYLYDAEFLAVIMIPVLQLFQVHLVLLLQGLQGLLHAVMHILLFLLQLFAALCQCDWNEMSESWR